MTSKQDTVDMGGLTLIVSNLKVNAANPGDAGTSNSDGSGGLVAGALTISAHAASAPTAAGGAAATAGATHVVAIDINGTTYYVLLTNANA